MGAARAEVAWLRSDPARIHAEAEPGYRLAGTRNHPWARGQLAYWLWRAGERVETPDRIPQPFRLHVLTSFLPAESSWRELGCPYEAAVALVDSGENDAMREGFAELNRLGATATSRVLRNELRSRGVTGIPRGPKRMTRSNAMGLTPRETEVLALLEEGLTNAEIASRLSLSIKTVGHHASAILGKLGVSSRRAAARHRGQLIHS